MRDIIYCIIYVFLALLLQSNLGCTQWIFKELFPSKQWNPSTTAFYLFIQPLTSLEECSITCTGNPRCRAVFIHENTCFGLSSLTPNSKLMSTVRTFIKQPQDECNGWDFVYYNGLCVLVSAIELDWFEARTYCENKNGNLLVLDSEQKVNDTKEFLKTYYRYIRSFYVGASDEKKEGDWKWITKTKDIWLFKFQLRTT
ncbi:unnamed protein product [Mytilus coruscus]|uniref:C-type lectin domain-containing protein n=1 Tax=Mytilus coruscus TaxID=42192 RepID=A0A6J8DRC7_MYTCO|nr:unnamed protein product [Mytilus coruscus]